jgi:poly-gamma-glutamate capsule biosynthesis protein CapA/YwtB (metallophosphatase superfamily)
MLRAKLMDALYSTLTNKNYDATTRVKISYSILQSASKYRYYKPTLKKYLRTHVRSQFLEINVNEWDIALFLPTESFRKADARKVHEDSIRKISRA